MTHYNINNCAVCNYPLGDDWQSEKVCPYCHTKYDLVTPKTDRSQTLVAPSDCRHPRTLFVSGSRDLSTDGSGSHTVTVCRDCGLFTVIGTRNGVGFSVTFDLATDESVAAAGKWNELLEASKRGDHRLADRQALFGDWMRRSG